MAAPNFNLASKLLCPLSEILAVGWAIHANHGMESAAMLRRVRG